MELEILKKLAELVPWGQSLLMILGTLVVIGQIVVAMTPSPVDDEAWAKLESIPFLGGFIKVLSAFAPIQKK